MPLDSEEALQSRIIAFARERCPDILVVPGLGELQDSSPKRIFAYRQGYTGGQPDLIVLPTALHKGLAIELKTPKAVSCPAPAENQSQWLQQLQESGSFDVMVSNDYEDVIIRLMALQQIHKANEGMQDTVSKFAARLPRPDVVLRRRDGEVFMGSYSDACMPGVFTTTCPREMSMAALSFAAESGRKRRRS